MLVNISMGGGGTGDAAAAAAGVNGDVLPHHVHFIPQYPHPTAHPYHIPVAAEPSKVDGLGGGEVVVVDPSPPSAAKSPAEIKEILESLTRNGAQLQHQQKSNTVATGIQSEKIESFFRKSKY